MSAEDAKDKADPENSKKAEVDNNASEGNPRPKEVGGRGGLDPTRYGDWEKSGRCVDF